MDVSAYRRGRGRGRRDAIIFEDRCLYLDGRARGEEEDIRVRRLVVLDKILGPAMVALSWDQRFEYYAPELSLL
jgi:hypothetical protein